MKIENYKAFTADLFHTLLERIKEAEQDSKENPDDNFKSGRSLAYMEVRDVLISRLDIYNIRPDDGNE